MLKQNRKPAIVCLVVANVGCQMEISPKIKKYFFSICSIICGQSIFLDTPIFPIAEFYLPKFEAIFNPESYWGRPQVVVKHIGTSVTCRAHCCTYPNINY